MYLRIFLTGLLGMMLCFSPVNGAYAETLQEIQKQADSGSALYQYKLAEMLANGQGVAQSYQAAEVWLKKAAAQGHAKAQATLGLFYYFGLTGPKNHVKALECFTLAAKQQDPVGLFNLGMMYLAGEGTKPDAGLAFKNIKAAAEQNYPTAIYNAAYLYETGQGVSRNYAEALKLYNEAAEHGIVPAMVNLAFMYEEGRGTSVNEGKALEWFGYAAENYDGVAMLKMAQAYSSGAHFEQDLPKAYIYLVLAMQKPTVISNENVYQNALRMKDELAAELDEKTLAQAHKTIQKLTPANMNAQ